jgi:hypothetical protein
LTSQFIFLGVIVCKSRHGRFISFAKTGLNIVVVNETTHAGSSPSTATSTLRVTSKRIATSEFSVTLGTNVRLLTSVQFTVTLEVVQTAETHLAFRAYVWFLLAMRQQMALEVVMACKLSIAVGTFVLL